MAITQNELELVRNELDAKIATVTVEHVSMAQAIGSYGERFTAMDARFDAVGMRIDYLSQDLDRRFEEVNRKFDDMTTNIDRQFQFANERTSDLARNVERLQDRTDSLNTKIDNRFGWQTVFMAALAFDRAVR